MARRPVRDRIENTTEKIPRGPRGFIGKGNAIGGAGVLTVSLANTFLPDTFAVGFNVESQEVERLNGLERHTFVINAVSKDVAESAAKFLATPSNVDFALSETEVVSTELVKERPTFSAWGVVVEVRE